MSQVSGGGALRCGRALAGGRWRPARQIILAARREERLLLGEVNPRPAPVLRHRRGGTGRRVGDLIRATGRSVRSVRARPAWLRLVAAGVTVVLWASAFVAIRGAGRDFSPGALALGRLGCGSLVLGLVAWARRQGWPPRAAWPGIVASGVLWFGVYMVALNWGEQKADAGTAAMVVGVGPVIIALLGGRLLGEGLPRSLLAGVAVSFAGVIVVGIATSRAGHAPAFGVLLCLLAALAYAVAVVSQKPALRHASALQVTTFGAAVGALACLPFTGQLVSQVASAPLPATLSVCYLGVFPTAVAFTTWAYALARTPAGTMGATIYLVPALTVPLSWSVLGQVPGWLAIAGGVLCLVGVAVSRRRPHPPGSPADPGHGPAQTPRRLRTHAPPSPGPTSSSTGLA
jgi:drug/metabolite transporter (DMT)-like permease